MEPSDGGTSQKKPKQIQIISSPATAYGRGSTSYMIVLQFIYLFLISMRDPYNCKTLFWSFPTFVVFNDVERRNHPMLRALVCACDSWCSMCVGVVVFVSSGTCFVCQEVLPDGRSELNVGETFESYWVILSILRLSERFSPSIVDIPMIPTHRAGWLLKLWYFFLYLASTYIVQL